jgi:flagellar basal-body rod modification protein FlgD
MPTTPVNGSTYDPTTLITQTSSSKPSSTLDKDGFLKLLTAQMANQDPTSSQDPSQYFQTISNMTMVEQLTNLSQNSDRSMAAQKTASATALIGRTVTYPGADGLPVTGAVASVQVTAKGTTLTVGSTPGVDPSILTEVR